MRLSEVHVVFEWASPVLPWAMSFVGSLLGILLATKARFRRGAGRAQLIAYASVALGGVAIWQMRMISLVGLSMPGLTPRLSPLWTFASLALAVASAALALLVAGRAAARRVRLIVAAIVLGVGIVATQFVALEGVRVGGTLDYEQRPTLVCLALAATAAAAMVWSTVALHTVRAALGAAAGTAALLTAVHYAAMWAVCVHVGNAHADVTGTSPLLAIVLVALVGGAATAMLAYFAFGRSTLHDIRAIYVSPQSPADPLQPAIIEQVTTLIDRAMAPTLLRTDVLAGDMVTHRRPPGPRPTPGLTPAWRSMPVWGNPTATAAHRHTRAFRPVTVSASSPVRYPPTVYRGSARAYDTQMSLQRNRGRFPGNA